mgnify:CR=1 FL=1
MKRSAGEGITSTKRKGRGSRKATRSQADQVAEPGTVQTKQELYLSVPGEPVGQPRHRVSTIGKRARMYLPKSHPVHDYKAAIRAAFIENAGKWRTIQGPVRVYINVWFSVPASWSRKKRDSHVFKYHAQKPDADNVTKAVLDALTDCGAWLDDSQVASCQVIKRWAGSEPTTLIEIVEL